MSDALEKHDRKVSICGRNITNLPFADDIVALAEDKQELDVLVEYLDKTCTRYKMMSAEKTELLTNSAKSIQREIKVKGQKLGTVTSFFKYLFVVVSDDSSKPEVLSMIAQAIAALTKLKPIWKITYLLDQR